MLPIIKHVITLYSTMSYLDVIMHIKAKIIY